MVLKELPIIEIDGKQYANTKIIADTWGLKRKTIAQYCREGRIKKAIKVSNRLWYIPTDEVKPLSKEEVHNLLVLTIQLKNKPSLPIDWSLFKYDTESISAIYNHLVEREFIEPFSITDNKRIPYEIVLTQKGLDIAVNYKNHSISDYSKTISQWLPTVIAAAQLIIQINQSVG